jgi:hypothetical protein
LVPSSDLRVVPIDPSQPMIESNIAIVDREGRTMLVNIWRNSLNQQLYAQALQSLLQDDDKKV